MAEFSQASGDGMNPHFDILVPAFHAEAYIERCLRSALTQEYDNFRVIFVDDHSADRTRDVGVATLREFVGKVRSRYWTTRERMGILANHIDMMADHYCDPDAVAICLDGDDQLSHPGVLKHLAQVYGDPTVWCTYGSYEYDQESRNPNGDCLGISRQVPPENHTRRAGWTSSHLKTFKVWLAQQIRREDLTFGGEWIDAAPDLALMLPMIEMAGPEHARFIPEILYLYNGRNPLNETKIKPAWVRVMTAEIMSRAVYPRLKERPIS